MKSQAGVQKSYLICPEILISKTTVTFFFGSEVRFLQPPRSLEYSSALVCAVQYSKASQTKDFS